MKDGFHALKRHYNGYRFCAGSPDIHNPFSLLSALSRGRIDSYWFGSGTPTSLINLMGRHGWDIAGLEGQQLVKVGVNFSEETRTIEEWVKEWVIQRV